MTIEPGEGLWNSGYQALAQQTNALLTNERRYLEARALEEQQERNNRRKTEKNKKLLLLEEPI